MSPDNGLSFTNLLLYYWKSFFRSNKSSGNQLSFTNVPKVLYENRYCNQEGFSILACGGIDKNEKYSNQVLEVKIPSFEATEFPSMEKRHFRIKITSFKFKIFGIEVNFSHFNSRPSSL